MVNHKLQPASEAYECTRLHKIHIIFKGICSSLYLLVSAHQRCPGIPAAGRAWLDAGTWRTFARPKGTGGASPARHGHGSGTKGDAGARAAPLGSACAGAPR